MQAKEFAETDAHQKFYDHRYKFGYMADWPQWKKDRIREIITSLRLPPRGQALEFGCGQGVFTKLIKDCLPGWEVYGSDLSTTAINLARTRFPSCRFFVAGDPQYQHLRFDFVLSHHVLEHVLELEQVFDIMAACAADSAVMLHILPCGNPGSLEHRLATLRRDGIDPQRGNRFWYEDEGHVRRMTTPQITAQLARVGFQFREGRYANQYYGTFNWVTTYPPEFIKDFTDQSKCNAAPADAADVVRLGKRIDRLKRAREFAAPGYRGALRDLLRALKQAALMPFAKAITSYYARRIRKEWQTRSREQGGSEMYVVAERQPHAAAPTPR